MNFTGIPSGRVRGLWGDIEHLVASALERGHGEYTTQDILEALLSRDMQLWTNGSAIAVTEIITYPQSSVCVVVLAAGGPMTEWLPCVSIIEAWAKSEGCTEIRAYGREGWARVMKDWQRSYTVVRKAL